MQPCVGLLDGVVRGCASHVALHFLPDVTRGAGRVIINQLMYLAESSQASQTFCNTRYTCKLFWSYIMIRFDSLVELARETQLRQYYMLLDSAVLSTS